MIDTKGKIQLTNGQRTIWVMPADAESWSIHGYKPAQAQPVAAILRPPVKRDRPVEEIQPAEDTANKENE